MAERKAAVICGMYAASALGRGADAQLSGALAGAPAFGPVRRFDVRNRRVTAAATLPEVGSLPEELAAAIEAAGKDAGLTRRDLAGSALFLAIHGRPDAAQLATELAARAGLAGPTNVYTSACVSASSAVADAATMVAQGGINRVIVAAGYLVEPDQFALFDAGRALSTDGAVRPFSAGRQGLLLGDGVAAVVIEAGVTGRRTGRGPAAEIVGWGRAGDAYHPCKPHPEGRGLARAIGAALRRAGLPATAIGYVNANATGTDFSDAAEAAGLLLALGSAMDRMPVSSTKSVHGHALEASALLELIVTVNCLRLGKLPVNAGFLGPDQACPLDVIVDSPRPVEAPCALSLNVAFGGANTALLVRAA